MRETKHIIKYLWFMFYCKFYMYNSATTLSTTYCNVFSFSILLPQPL